LPALQANISGSEARAARCLGGFRSPSDWRASYGQSISDEVRFYESLTYPANLCPLSGRVEFAHFGENLGESIGKAVEAVSRRSLGQGSAEHFDCMLGKEQGVNNAIYARTGRDHWRSWPWGEMARL
jgi:hypothetical protein